MTITIGLSLLFYLVLEFAQAEVQPLQEQEALTDLLLEIRDPVFTSQERTEALHHVQKKMIEHFIQETNTPETKLKKIFKEHPTRASVLLTGAWPDLQSQFYVTLHQEELMERWKTLKHLVNFTSFGEGLFNSMMGHLGNFSPTNEGRYYLRWHEYRAKKDSNDESYSYPFFLHSMDLETLLETETHVPYEDLIAKKELPDFQNKTAKLSLKKKQELAEKRSLIQRIYLRAIANSAKTIASLHYLTGIQDLSKTEDKVNVFVEKFCSNCSQKEKKEYIAGAMNYIQSGDKYSSRRGTKVLTEELCQTLKDQGYFWNMDRLKPTPLDILQDQRKLLNYYTIHKLKDKNRLALAKAILEHEFGILFLTNSINVLDSSEGLVGTKLACLGQTAESDQGHVQEAIEEAQSNVEAYIERVNKLLTSDLYSLKMTSDIIDYFVQTNQAATVEALATYPQGMGWVLKSIAELEQNVARRKKVDAVVSWGGAIIGVGLTITGIGAPEGVAILLSTVGMIKGLTSGAYFAVRAKQEKNFAKEIRMARSGNALITDENLKFHYKNYKSLKVSYIREFACTGLSFISLHRLALKQTSGDLTKSHSILKKVLMTTKGEIKSNIIENLQTKILEQTLAF